MATLIEKRSLSEQVIEMTFALNVLAPFLLTNLLLPALEASVPARIINVNSMVYRYGAGLDLNDLPSRQAYRPMKVYSKAKFANLLMTYEFARRLAGRRKKAGGCYDHELSIYSPPPGARLALRIPGQPAGY